MILVGVVLAVLVAMMRGGRIERLSSLGIKGLFWVWIALGIRYFAVGYLAGIGLNLPWLQIVAYCLFIYVLWVNFALPGMKLFAAGSLLNFVVIAINGGAMPVSASAIAIAGISGDPGGTHTLIHSATRLWILADIIPFRIPFTPLAQVISVGDILIVAGIFLFIQHRMLRADVTPPAKTTGRLY